MYCLVYWFMKCIGWDLSLLAAVTTRLVTQTGLCDLRAYSE